MDTKLTALPATTAPLSTDDFYVVTDPGGTPTSNKVTGANMGKALTVVGKVTVTQPATSATLTIADGKTLTSSNTLTLTGTDGSSVALGAGGTVAYASGVAGGQTIAGGTLTTQNLTLRGNAADTTTGTVAITTSTASTNTTTGALTVAGGLGVAGKINTLDLAVTNTITGSISGNAATATALQTARTIGGTSFDGTANITVATATGGFTVSGGNLALGANNLTMTGSLAATGARVTKGWFTDVESTNMPTVGGTSLSSTFSPIAGSASIVTVGTVTSGVWNAGAVTSSGAVQGTTGVFTAASSLTLGTASSATGAIILKNATNAFTTTIQSGVSAASRVYTLPTDFGAAGTVLTDAAGNGTLSWAAPALAWGATATGTSGTGVALTVDNSASAGTIGQSITIGNTQTNAITGLKIDCGTSTAATIGISLLNVRTGLNITGQTNTDNGGGISCTLDYSGTNTNSASSTIRFYLYNGANAGSGYNTGVWIRNHSSKFLASAGGGQSIFGMGLGVEQKVAGGTAMAVFGNDNVNTSTNGLINYTLSNTQSGATVMQKTDTGTSAQAHVGHLTQLYNANTSAIAYNAQLSSTGTGTAYKATGSADFIGLLIEANQASSSYPIKITHSGTTSWETIGIGSGALGGLYLFDNDGTDNLVAMSVNRSGNVGADQSSAAMSFYYDETLTSTATYDRNADFVLFRRDATSTNTANTRTENFIMFDIQRNTTQNGAGGTYLAQGTVLAVVNSSTQTAGTLTDTVDIVGLTQSSSATTGKLITGVVGATERFKVHPMVANSGTNTAYIFDTTTSLSGTTNIATFGNAGTTKATIDNTGALTLVGRLYQPMAEAAYFNTTGTAITISAQSDGSTNMVVVNPTTTFSNDTGFDNGGGNTGRLRYTGATTRMFHCAITISGSPATNNDEFVFGLAKNGTVDSDCKIIQKFGTTSDSQSTALHCMVSLATNDYIELYVGNLSAARNITIKTLNLFAMGM